MTPGARREVWLWTAGFIISPPKQMYIFTEIHTRFSIPSYVLANHFYVKYSKADPGPARRAPPPPPVEIYLGFIFVNFDCFTRIKFNYSYHTLFTKLYHSLLSQKKHRVCVKGHQIKPQTPRILGPRPPVLKFLDPPLILDILVNITDCCFLRW